MLAETLTVVSAANAAIGQIKTLVSHGNDISSMGRQLGAILTAEETLQAQGNSKKKSLFSKALGKDNDSFEEFMHLEKIREARKEIESMMKIYGRAGLYQDWVNFQREERVRKKQEAEDRAKARAFFVNLAQWSIAGLIIFGSAFGLLYWAWLNRGW